MTKIRIVKVDPLNPRYDYLKEAADIIRSGGLVIIPTDTVYGIAADAFNKKAVEKLYAIKKRPKDKPFSLLIDESRKAEEYAADIPVSAYKLMDKFWPGPLTLILKSKVKGSIGLRMPDNDVALKIITLSRAAVACPSANLSGKPATGDFEEAVKGLSDLVDFAVDSGRTKLQMESTVADLTAAEPAILRAGAIKKEDILSTAKKKNVLFVCTGNSCRSVMAEALLKKKLQELNRNDIEVFSAGLMMLTGMGATDETKELLKTEGIDVSAHRSQRITAGMLNKSDIILVMEKLHEERILQLHPHLKNRLFLLKEFARVKDINLDIPDPIGQTREFYDSTFTVIKEAVERIIQLL